MIDLRAVIEDGYRTKLETIDKHANHVKPHIKNE